MFPVETIVVPHIANLNQFLANYAVLWCCVTHLNRYCISLFPTDENPLPHQPNSVDAQASLRAEVLQQISAAHDELSKVLDQLGSNDTGRIQIALQLSNLSALRQQASLATGTTLQQMQAQIANTVANAQALATGSTEMGGGSAAEKLAEASAKARQTAQDFVRDYYDNHKFEKDLQFQSEQDERDYREREAARKKAIEEALAAHTPEGAARALLLEQAQLQDAGKHGADKSPDFQEYTAKLKAEADNLQSAISENRTDKKVDAAIVANADNQTVAQSVDMKAALSLKQAGVVLADQSDTGHGVKIDASIAALIGRA
ncbi:hypothetical protein [Asticcacaulis benevestitus]|uniref:Uncharacterized protein n=1 Tax=Asticcacaulis benevestitus DSM 16100 = ATCC BAA-896 TaxID=1121022 RepID=V4P4G9_9CAUL|nr:hypothetical protein [Asticcacaulis benevestitus]ESQ82991.1 hypothetical protein ABENE_20500 [Asticcacaulis benevestitus DSM 16100 = ATCC BAA-896]